MGTLLTVGNRLEGDRISHDFIHMKCNLGNMRASDRGPSSKSPPRSYGRPNASLNVIVDWCVSNLSGEFFVGMVYMDAFDETFYCNFYFELVNDAVLFKLKF